MGCAAVLKVAPLRVLHVGCGGGALPLWFDGEVIETRLDINPDTNPHIVASMTSLGEIGSYDAVVCSHALEHLSRDDANTALCEFRRVLVHGGNAFVLVPDLEGVSPTDEVLYVSQVGPITGLDLYYGHQGLSKTNPFMAHKTGFVQGTLERAFTQAGFRGVVARRVPDYNLLAVGRK